MTGCRLAGLDAPENYAGIDSTEAKRIAQDVIQLGRSAVIWNNIEIAGRIGVAVIQGWRNPSFLQSERTDRRFHRTRRPQRMRGVRLRAAHRQGQGTVAEHLFDRHRLGAVVESGRAGVRVDVIDLGRREPRISQRSSHRAYARFATRQRGGHMERVVVQTVTEDFRENVRAAPLCVFKLFYHERCRAFPNHESIAFAIEWSARERWIAGPLAHRLDNCKSSEGEGTEWRFSAPGHDNIREVIPDVTERFSDRDGAACTTI